MTTLRTILRFGTGALIALALTRVEAETTAPPPTVEELLSAIDFVPARSDLDPVMGSTPTQELIALANSADEGVRVRAIRALAQYPAPETRDALVALIQDPKASGGLRVVLRRAALEALAEIGTPDDVEIITPYLEVTNAPERDLRAAAAHALRVLGSTAAVPALRAQQRIEEEPQVLFAITEALRKLLGGL